MPDGPAPLLRWGMVLLVLLVAELGLRAARDLHLIEEPVLYRHANIDAKVLNFLGDFLPADLPGRRILFIGSSVAASNLDPVAVSEEIGGQAGDEYTGYNFGLYGGRFEDFEFLADWVYRRWPYDKLVVVLEPWGLRHWSMDIRGRMTKNPLEDWLMRRTALMAYRGQVEPYDRGRDARSRGYEELDNTPTLHGWNRTVLQHFQEDLEYNASRYAGTLMDESLDPPAPYEVETEYPFRMRAKAARRDVPVYWVLPPVHPIMEEFIPAEFNRENRRAIGEFFADAPGNHLVDLLRMEIDSGLDEDEDFFDATHLNGLGASKFSRELGRELGAFLSGGEPGDGSAR